MPSYRWVVVFDFDGTLTGSQVPLIPVVCESFGRVNARFDERQRRIFDHYHSLYKDRSLDAAGESRWSLDTGVAFVEEGLSRRDVDWALARVSLRPGVVEGLEELKRRRVPVAIVTFGCATFVRVALEQRSLGHLVDDVLGFELVADEDGNYRDVAMARTVNTFTKGHHSMAFAGRFGCPRKRVLAVGDSWGDRHLGGLRRNRLGVVENDAQAGQLLSFTTEVRNVSDGFAPATEWLLAKIDG